MAINERLLADEISGARQTEEEAWKKRITERAYLHSAKDPQLLTGFYELDPLTRPDSVDDADVKFIQHAATKKGEFVAALEEADTKYKGEIPMSFWMEMGPTELRAFGGPEFEDLATYLEDAAANASYWADFERQVDQEWEAQMKRFENRTNAGSGSSGWDFLASVSGFATIQDIIGGDAPTREDVRTIMLGRQDTLYEDEIAAFMDSERRLLEAMREGAEPLEEDYGKEKDRGYTEDRFFLSNGDYLSEEDHMRFWESERDFLRGLGNQRRQGLDITRVSDAEFEEILATRESILRQQIQQAKGQSEINKIITPGVGIGFWEGGVNAVGWVADKAIRFGAFAMESDLAFGAGPMWEAVKRLSGTAEQSRDETLAQIRAETGIPDFEKIEQWLNEETGKAWAEMEQQEPDVHEEYMRMANGNATMAMGFFQADLESQISPEDQLRYLDDLAVQEDEMIVQLQEQDFTLGDDLLHVMGFWGRNVPMRLGTMFSVMVSDEDIQGIASSGDWIGFLDAANRESEKYGHTPSAQMGIEGTFAGLMVDLGFGVAFDPTTWIFGPRLTGRTSMAATASQARALGKSRMVRQMADDVMDAAASPSRGASGMYQLADWLDPVSMGEFLRLVDFNPQSLPATPWRAIKGSKAAEVRVDLLGKLIPDELRATIDDVSTLGDDVAKNGFQDVLEISISRSDETVWVSDGVKRIIASEQKGITHAPVRVRVTDTAPAVKLVVPGFADETVANMQRIKEMIPDVKGANEGTRGLAIERTQELFDAGAYRGKAYEVGGETLPNGENVTWHFAPGPDIGTGGQIFGVSDDGKVVVNVTAVSKGSTPGGSGFGRIADDTWKGQDLLGRALDKAHELGEDLINNMHFDSLSEQGHAALLRYVNRHLDDAVPQASQKGFPIRELLNEGEDLGKVLKPPKKKGANNDVLVRPDALLPKRLLSGLDDSTRQAVYEVFQRAIMERGAIPTGSQYAAVARHSGEKIRKLAKANAPGSWIQQYVTPMSVTKRYEMAGPHFMNKLVDSAYRIWGKDTVNLNKHLERFMGWQKRNSERSAQAAQKLSALKPRLDRLQKMKQAVGNTYDDALKHLREQGIDFSTRDELVRVVAEEEKALRRALADIDAETGVIGATDELEQMILEMWEDYNRTHIATNPAWANVVEDGMVPWEQLGKGKIKKGEATVADDAARALPEDMLKLAEELDIDAEGLMQLLSHNQNAKLATEVPVSALELQLASVVGGAAYTRFTHWSGVSQLRETAMALHRLWTIDKVFTVATAMTVSFDELLRIFHIGGLKAGLKWFGHRATAWEARIQAALHGKAPRVREGAEYLSPKKQERLRNLKDYSAYLKQLERNTMEQHALGWEDIRPGQAGYDDAARQWTAGFLQDSGFRAFLRGEDSFREWFFSPDGERLRRGTVIDKSGKTVFTDAWEQYYQGWKTIFDDLILRPAKDAGKYSEVRNAWVRIADDIDNTGGLPKDLPDVAINYLGPVRGVRRDIPNKLSVSRMQESFFDQLFMNPVNFRRGFLADLTRTHQKSRLTSLYHSQGKTIMPDAQVEALLGLEGLSGAQRTGLRGAIQEMAINAGYVPESYIDDLVEQAVLREIENTLYAFDASSRMGAQARAVFPFGKPWADMAGFWGREIVRKPVLRGWINDKNALWLRSANERGLLSFPLVPNRSSALLSRLAHTDFTLDEGLFGAEESDFSPLFFLPTKGENPFSYMIPGLGYIPIMFLDKVMAELHDPVKNPVEYANLQDELGQFIPSVHFQQGGWLSRLLGGGSAAKVGGALVDIAGMFGQDSYFNITSQMGDISREIDRTREISALLADPDELQLLLDADSAEEAELLLQGLAVEADQRASGSHLAESTIRYMVPVGNRFDASLAEIENVWLDAAQFEELGFLDMPDTERMTDEQRRQLANDIRSEFFKLEPWQRDALIVQQPSLAVNTVGSWEWTPQAINEGLNGTDYAYRTGGTVEDLARHESLVRRGYIRPVQPIVRARRILGVIDNAKKSAAKELYTEQLNQVNTLLWDAVPEEEKAKLEWVLGTEFAQDWGLETVEEVWTHWRTIEEDLEIYLAEDAGIDPVRGPSTRKDDLTEFDLLRRAVSIPDEWKPWGSSFPGLDEEGVPTKVNEWRVFEVDEKSSKLAEALGIPLTEGMTGEALYNEVQQMIVQRQNYVFDVVRPDYERYIEDRSNRSGRNMLYEAAQSDLVAPEFQDKIHQFLFKHDLVKQRQQGTGRSGATLADSQKMKEEFLYIMNGAKDQKTNWEGIWEEQFERTYGPLDWTPPEPKSPFDENGDAAAGVIVPYVRHVVDGDTLLIQEYKGSPRLNSVRLLGVRAEEVNGPRKDIALDQEEALKDALLQAVENGDNIYLVRDERFGDTDRYGRMLAWLWIGDTPYYNVEDLLPTRDPGGDN